MFLVCAIPLSMGSKFAFYNVDLEVDVSLSFFILFFQMACHTNFFQNDFG